MKKTRLLPVFVTLLLVFTFVCLAEEAPFESLRIAVSSDLHYQQPTALSSLVNPLVTLNREITEAMLWTASENDADILLLCGDISNGGSPQQHAMLVEKLHAAQDRGLRIIVLPGNHDIGWTTPELFASFYQDFGYNDAFSRDPNSLSYSVLLGHRMLILLDTDGYESNHYKARIKTETLVWLQNQLQVAKKEGLQVLCAGHYPLLTQQTTAFENRQETIDLLHQYNVALYLCGHMHGRHVAADQKLTELAIDQDISAPCCYAIIDLDENGSMRYTPAQIAVSRWAAATGHEETELLHFDEYQREQSQIRHSQLIDSMAEKHEASPETVEAARDFLLKLFEYNAHGTMYLHADELSAHPGYAAFMEIGAGSNYDLWVPTVLSGAVPYTAGFVIDGDGNLSAGHE